MLYTANCVRWGLRSLSSQALRLVNPELQYGRHGGDRINKSCENVANAVTHGCPASRARDATSWTRTVIISFDPSNCLARFLTPALVTQDDCLILGRYMQKSAFFTTMSTCTATAVNQ